MLFFNEQAIVLQLDVKLVFELFAISIAGAGFGLLVIHFLRKWGLSDAPKTMDVDQFHQSAALNAAPFVLWVEKQGRFIWGNDAYRALVQNQDGKYRNGLSSADLSSKTRSQTEKGILVQLKTGDDTKNHWYEIVKSEQGAITFFFGTSAEETVKAKDERNRFVQTLTETFAHLPIGLAVFDKSRDLSLFNPALSALLSLPPEWLAQRPSLRSFLDRLHHEGFLPEPKDFRGWRDNLVDLESGAEEGSYSDDWHLPNGKIYRVRGRPHPQGAVAFLFEDISTAVSAERHFRSEVELFQAALENLDSAIVILDQTGTMIFANQAFETLWGVDSAAAADSYGLTDLTRMWRERCSPSPVWGDFRDYATSFEERAPWDATVTFKTGETFTVSFSVLTGGATMCAFTFLFTKTDRHRDKLVQAG